MAEKDIAWMLKTRRHQAVFFAINIEFIVP